MKDEKPILTDNGTERAVLSIIAQHGSDSFYDIADIIGVNSFTNVNNQAIFKCIESIIASKKEIDIPTIIAQAEELHLSSLVCKEKPDLEYLRALFSFDSSKANVRAHANKLAKLEIAREARLKHFEAVKELSQITGSESIDRILSISEEPIFELITKLNQGKENTPRNFGESVDKYIEFVETNENVNVGVPTPFPIWNDAVGGGIRRGGVALVITRPKGRKSTFAVNTGIHTCSLNVPTLYLDTEMVLDEQLPRILANISNSSALDIERGNFKRNAGYKQKITDAANKLKNMRFFHKSVAGKPFEEILSIIRRWILQEVGYDDEGRVNNCLVIYDYFKIMASNELEGLQEYQAIGFQIGKLTDFCKEYDFPCLAFTQVNRDGITKESTDIISQSDRLLWLCQSATLLKKKTPEEILEDGRENGNMKLKILECRFGPGLEDNDYINVALQGNSFKMDEVNTRYEVIKNQQTKDTGFSDQINTEIKF